MPAEKAWTIPHEINIRAGTFEMRELVKLTATEYAQYFSKPSKLHRFPAIMAKLLHAAIQRIQGQYAGDASRIWADSPSSGELIYRLLQFQGVGQKIATMTANILARHFHVRLADKYSIDVSIDGLVPRVLKRAFDLPTTADATELIYFARSMNPEYPGIIDYEAWRVGSNWCEPKNPKCRECAAKSVCSYAKKRSNKPSEGTRQRAPFNGNVRSQGGDVAV